MDVAPALVSQELPATATQPINLQSFTSLRLGSNMLKGLALSCQRTCQNGEAAGALTLESDTSRCQTKREIWATWTHLAPT